MGEIDKKLLWSPTNMTKIQKTAKKIVSQKLQILGQNIIEITKIIHQFEPLVKILPSDHFFSHPSCWPVREVCSRPQNINRGFWFNGDLTRTNPNPPFSIFSPIKIWSEKKKKFLLKILIRAGFVSVKSQCKKISWWKF